MTTWNVPADAEYGLGPATILRGDARHLPLADDSVDLIVTSPPYFALRSYQDGGEHYGGQIGSEPTPQEFVDALLDCTREMVRVLKPTGSIWVNLGDKYAGGGQGGNVGGALDGGEYLNRTPTRARVVPTGFRTKSLLGLPWRYALRCIDDLGLILRAEMIWSKPNGLPESVSDRVRRSHEQWFHFVKQPCYFAAVDEIREPSNPANVRPQDLRGEQAAKDSVRRSKGHGTVGHPGKPLEFNPLGKLPGSVREVPSQPLKVPPGLGVDHFAAFPSAWPAWIIRGWSPSGICVECGEGRRPVVASVALNMSRPQARRAQELADQAGLTEAHFQALLSVGVSDTGRGAATQSGTGKNTPEVYALAAEARQALGGYAREYLLRRPTGFTYACNCPAPDAPTRPAVVLDPFGGTGTTAMAARALGRHGISVDRSADYCRLAQWRVDNGPDLAAVKGLSRRAYDQRDSGEPSLFNMIGETS